MGIESVGKNIKKYREEKNWHQEELAEKLGVTQKAVSSWENGKAYPRMNAFDNMCKLFNCRLSDLTADGYPVDFRLGINGMEMFVETRKPSPAPGNETRLLKIFKKLNEAQQRQVIDFAIDMMEADDGSEV